MLDLFPFPNINASDLEALKKQVNNYLLNLKESLEFEFMRLSSENLSAMTSVAKSINESNTQRDDQITQVSSKVTSASDGAMSAISQTADAIRTEVSKSYELKTDAKEAYQGLSSLITQTSESIKSEVNKTIEEVETNLQQQIDGAIETFTGDEVPTLDNAPANEWTTDEMKDLHIKDLYIVSSNGGDYAGFYYRFEKANGVYQWTLLKDTEVTKALEEAREANEKADALAEELATKYYTKTETHSAIDQKADEINLSVTEKVTETREYADEIDAKHSSNNYLLDSKEERTIGGTTYKLADYKNELTGKSKVLSFWAEPLVEGSVTISFDYEGSSAMNINDKIVVSGEGKRYSKTLSRSNFDAITGIKFSASASSCLIKEAKLEMGSYSTDWTPSYSTTEQMQSAIDMKADEISLSVTEALKDYSTTEQMRSEIEMKADSITSTVAKSQDKWIVDTETYSIDIYGYGTPANAMAEPDKTYLDMEDGWIYQTATNDEGRYVWTMVGECQKTTDDIYSKIEQNAYGISQKVSNGKVISEINQSAEEIELKGNRVIIESDKFQLDKYGSATFTSDAEVWLMPTASDVDKIMDVALGRITVSDSVFRAMDFNCDGKVNVTDFIAGKAILLGKDSVDYYKVAFGYQKQYSKVTLKIQPDNAEKPILISGTNSFGTYIESYFGGTTTSIDQLLAEGANIGKIACGEIETSSGNNLDNIATRLATVEARLGISS